MLPDVTFVGLISGWKSISGLSVDEHKRLVVSCNALHLGHCQAGCGFAKCCIANMQHQRLGICGRTIKGGQKGPENCQGNRCESWHQVQFLRQRERDFGSDHIG